MSALSFFERIVRQPLSDLLQLNPEQRASAVRSAVSDLHFFFDEGCPLAEREAPARTRSLAQSLHDALAGEKGAEEVAAAATLRERLVTDAFLRAEADKDQNVYLGKLFTRTLTRAVPDLIFQPATLGEAAAALRWARTERVPVTLRGAASAAMGGAVPNDAGLTLDLTRLDQIDLDAAQRVAIVGAGARMRVIHQQLAEHGLALRVYPSNLGGTLCGWFATGGIGMNAFGNGRALDSVRAADVLLPSGIHIRFHDDGRLDVPDEGPRRRTLASGETASWFAAHGLQPMTLADFAGSEGTLGLLVRLTVAVEPRPEIGAFLLSFETREQALEATTWVTQAAGARFPAPANVKLLSGAHLEHVRRVWQDEDAREWHEHPSALSAGTTLPWTRIVGPEGLGAKTGAERSHARGYLYVDFLDLAAARAFAEAIALCPGAPRVLEADTVRFAAERFRPMQTKRLGPGLLAAEIVMPASEVPRFLPEAERFAANAGPELDAEVYYLADGSTLVIAAYLTDHRSGAFAIDLLVAPALVDLAMTRFGGRPYVLGRWQAAWFRRRFSAEQSDRLLAMKQRLDPAALMSRGVLFGFRLRGALGAITAATFQPGVSLFRSVGSGGLSGLLRGARGALAGFGGPAKGRGEPAVIGATFRATPVGPTPAVRSMPPQQAAARALHCVNCGECNSVCPIFHESGVRLPQMLTHLGEGMFAGEAIGRTGGVLLDLCMRCGNCEEVCQAGIPHLPLYEVMQAASEREPEVAAIVPDDRRERHTAILMALRGSSRYTRQFLDIRPGGYLKRTPASLPGMPRFVLLRAENDEGPAATCIHCGACVSVCPTSASLEFQGDDPRWITTDQSRCIGCGTCVEVCPANMLNGGQTLRVMEAPTRDWFVALDEIEQELPT